MIRLHITELRNLGVIIIISTMASPTHLFRFHILFSIIELVTVQVDSGVTEREP